MSMQLWAGRALALVGVLAALTARAQAEEQSEVGVGVGGFFDVRTESKIGPSDTTFTYSGARLAARGEKWGEAYVDLGWETLDRDRYDSGGGRAVGVQQAQQDLRRPANGHRQHRRHQPHAGDRRRGQPLDHPRGGIVVGTVERLKTAQENRMFRHRSTPRIRAGAFFIFN